MTGALNDQPKNISQGFEIIDFIPLGQASLVLVIKDTQGGMVYFTLLENLQNNRSWMHTHQGDLIGYCTDD